MFRELGWRIGQAVLAELPVHSPVQGLGVVDQADAQHGIELAAHLLDNEVIAPAPLFPPSAFSGTSVLPDFFMTRAMKGSFNAVAYAGLREHAPVLRESCSAPAPGCPEPDWSPKSL